MLRLNAPGGNLTASQLRLISRIASEQGGDFADLTASQTFQLPGISVDQRESVLSALETAGLRPAAPEALTAVESPWDSIGVYEQDQPDLFSIGIPILAGRIDSVQLKKVADLAERYADGGVRLTDGQNLLLRGVGKERVAQVMEGLESVGLKVKASAIARSVRPCPAGGEDSKPAQEVRTLVEVLDRRVSLDEPARIYLGSCEEGCPQCATAQVRLRKCRIELDGQTVEGYDVYVGGQRVEASFPPSEAPRRLEQLLIAYKRSRHPGEPVGEFCHRVGNKAVAEFLADHQPEETSA